LAFDAGDLFNEPANPLSLSPYPVVLRFGDLLRNPLERAAAAVI